MFDWGSYDALSIDEDDTRTRHDIINHTNIVHVGTHASLEIT